MSLWKYAYDAGMRDALTKLSFQPPAPKKHHAVNTPATETAIMPSGKVTLTAPAPGATPAATASAAKTVATSATTPAAAGAVSAADLARQTQGLTPRGVSAATADAGRGSVVGDRGGGTGVPAGATPKGAPYASTGTSGAAPGAPVAPAVPNTAAISGSKAAEFNMGMTPDPRSESDKVPSPDNGRRMYGTQFSDALRPLRDVDQAFNGLNIQKNTDVLNSAGQAEFGTPRG